MDEKQKGDKRFGLWGREIKEAQRMNTAWIGKVQGEAVGIFKKQTGNSRNTLIFKKHTVTLISVTAPRGRGAQDEADQVPKAVRVSGIFPKHVDTFYAGIDMILSFLDEELEGPSKQTGAFLENYTNKPGER